MTGHMIWIYKQKLPTELNSLSTRKKWHNIREIIQFNLSSNIISILEIDADCYCCFYGAFLIVEFIGYDANYDSIFPM